jgi:NADH:ubiquinone oxidoreductase subunit 3 (subunit A)
MEYLIIGLMIIIVFLVAIIFVLNIVIMDKDKEIELQRNLAKTFEAGYDKLKNKRG